MSKIEVNEIDAQSGTTITVGSACKSVAVPGNVVKTNAVQASDGGNIVSQSGTTITLGASGDTVSLASGASQSGFGRTGTVDWQTTIKTSGFTAANGEGYFVDTNSGSITVNLPSASAGDIVAFKDYRNTFDSHNLIVSPNGTDKIGGVNATATFDAESQSVTLIFTDSTRGWLDIHDSTTSAEGLSFITASGGTESTSGNCKIHTFTGPGSFVVSGTAACSANNAVAYLVVAGGAGGGFSRGGGGGAGGYREGRTNPITPYTASPLATTGHTVSVQSYPITVGGGGTAGGPSPTAGGSGNPSVFSSFTGAGGGGGGSGPTSGASCGVSGGSGGGSRAGYNPGNSPVQGNGNTPPVSPPQGSNGGAGFDGVSVSTNGGGGGGAGACGSNGISKQGGAGGAGTTSSINGTPTTRAGGGGGGTDGGNGTFQAGSSPADGGAGGSGGGGAGNPNAGNATPAGTAGTANTGGGGGGGGASTGEDGGAGGSGIVIIRYKFQ